MFLCFYRVIINHIEDIEYIIKKETQDKKVYENEYYKPLISKFLIFLGVKIFCIEKYKKVKEHYNQSIESARNDIESTRETIENIKKIVDAQ